MAQSSSHREGSLPRGNSHPQTEYFLTATQSHTLFYHPRAVRARTLHGAGCQPKNRHGLPARQALGPAPGGNKARTAAQGEPSSPARPALAGEGPEQAPARPLPGVTAHSPPPRRKTSALRQDGAAAESLSPQAARRFPALRRGRANGCPLGTGRARRLAGAGRQSRGGGKPLRLPVFTVRLRRRLRRVRGSGGRGSGGTRGLGGGARRRQGQRGLSLWGPSGPAGPRVQTPPAGACGGSPDGGRASPGGEGSRWHALGRAGWTGGGREGGFSARCLSLNSPHPPPRISP